MSETPEKMMRVYRVARVLDVSKKRVYQMVREGKLDAVRLGPRSMRVTNESLQRFIDTGRRQYRDDPNLGVARSPQP